MPNESKVTSSQASQPPTLKQIADASGVHASTVSRVLRQKVPSGGWSESNLRVLRVAAEMGYRPNFLAAGLRTRRTYTIGVVMPRLADGVIASMCQAVEEAATLAGYQIILATPPDEMDAQLKSVQLLTSRKIDGLIVSSLHLGCEDLVRDLTHIGIPVIAVNRRVDGQMPAVTTADRQGGRLATNHLIGLGHRRIGIIAGPRHASTAWDRTQGYFDALREHGIQSEDALVVHTDFEVEGGILGANRLLSLAQPPTAIFSVNDTAAIGVIGAARDRGISIPEELSLIGYNDIPLVAQLPTPLTTVSSPSAPMGTAVVHELLRGIAGAEMVSSVLPVSLVVRCSTANPAARG